jgi:hypothetical protein
MPYLLKSEPDAYSFADLERDGETVWDGVTNPVAVKNLQAMKPGEKLIIYHTGSERTAVGTATVTSVDEKKTREHRWCGSEPANAWRLRALWPTSKHTNSLRTHRSSGRAVCRSCL